MVRPIIFDPRVESKQKGTAGQEPLRPWEVECNNCDKEAAFKILLNGVLIVDKIGIRNSDVHECTKCGHELYEVTDYFPTLDGWTQYDIHIRNPEFNDYIRYVDIDQIDLIKRLTDMVDATRPTQRLSTISLMLEGIWDILDKMDKQVTRLGDANRYDINTLQMESVKLRDLVHKKMKALDGV